MQALAGLVVVGVLLWGLVVVLMRGFWAKNVEPIITTLLVTWWGGEAQRKQRDDEFRVNVNAWDGSLAQVAARKAEFATQMATWQATQYDARAQDVLRTVNAWHSAPDQVRTRRELIQEEIDNQVQRVDGIIHKEIKARVEQGTQPLQRDMSEIKAMLEKRELAERDFREEVIGKLAHLEGLFLSPGSSLRAPTVPGSPPRGAFGSHKRPGGSGNTGNSGDSE